MGFWDWLLGDSEIGWLKTALLSVLLATPVFAVWLVLFDPNGELPSNKYYVIAVGYPILWFTRRQYWSRRARYFGRLVYERDAAALDELQQLIGRNIALYSELFAWMQSLAKERGTEDVLEKRFPHLYKEKEEVEV